MTANQLNIVQDYITVAKNAVFEAGQIALSFEQKNFKSWYKSENQPVTEVDIKVNNYLKKKLKNITPNFGWLSEESVDDKSRLSKKYFWCLDPIDGTRSFINGKPEYTISLALMEGHNPIIGIIYNPRTNEMFSAKKNHGSFCNENKISVEDKDINESKVALSNSEFKILKKYKKFSKLKTVIIGSIAYKIALVAKGEIDIALSFTKKNDWDLAAGSLIIEEADGYISEMNGKKIIYNSNDLLIPSIIATNKRNHKKLIENLLVK